MPHLLVNTLYLLSPRAPYVWDIKQFIKYFLDILWFLNIFLDIQWFLRRCWIIIEQVKFFFLLNCIKDLIEEEDNFDNFFQPR